tara:strand:- start:331 stop:1143 length:813 start_codon:yes stop_codon:yes gene_type:complete
MKNADTFVALVLAADRTTSDPITTYTGAACKAIAPICGTPMILRVLDALEASSQVASIVLCGPPESVLSDCPELKQRIESGRVTWLANLDAPSRSAQRGFEHLDSDTPVLLTTADHALLTTDIVDYFLTESRATNSDATLGLVRHEDIVAAFPDSKRTVMRLRDGGLCGCNLYTFNGRGRELVTFWRQVEDKRKRPWQLIAHILDLRLILAYLFGLLTLERALKAVSDKLDIQIQAVILPFPQAGVDVDKVEDLHLAESILTNRTSPTNK